MVNKVVSLAGSFDAQYSNGPDSGCLVRVGDNVVAADEGENHALKIPLLFRWPGLPS